MKKNNRTLIDFLKNSQLNGNLLETFKIRYRPHICPYDILLSYINKGDTIFDIGCGSGQFLYLAAEISGPKALFGIDVSNQSLINAKNLLNKFQNSIQISLQSYNGYDIPDNVSKSDVIFMIDVFHHLNKLTRINYLKCLVSKMNNDTLLIIKDIDLSHPFVFLNKFHDLIFSKQFSKEIRKSEMETILQELGLIIIKSDSKVMLWYPHYWIVCKKQS